MNRPIIFITFAYVLGVLLAGILHPPLILTLVVFAAALLLLALPQFRNRFIYFIIVFALLGAFRYSYFTGYIPPNDIRKVIPGKTGSFEVYVSEFPEENEERIYFTGDLVGVDGTNGRMQNIRGKIRITVEKNLPVKIDYGDTLKVFSQIKAPELPKNPGQFDYREYLKKRGVFYTAYAKVQNVETISVGGNPFVKFSFALKKRLVEIIYASLPFEEAKILDGIMLGNQRAMSDEVYDSFKITGTVHILAVSGMNVSLVALFIFFMLKLFGIKIRPAAVLTLISVAVFTVITGGGASITRAAIMAAFVLAGYIIDRDADVLNSLCAAALVILILNPQDVYDIGFQLSFLATFGLVYLSEYLKNQMPAIPEAVSLTVSSSLAAQLILIPSMANIFHQVSVVSLAANIFIVPLASMITILGFAMWLAGFAGVWLTKIFGASIWLLIKVMMFIVSTLAKIPYAAVSVKTLPLIFIICYFAFIISLPHEDLNFRFKKINGKFIFGLMLCLWFCIHLTLPDFRFGWYALSTRGINSVFCVSHMNKKVVVLGVDDENKNGAVKNVIIPFLRYKGVNNIDELLLYDIKNRETIDALKRNFHIKNISEAPQDLDRALDKDTNLHAGSYFVEIGYKAKAFIFSKMLIPSYSAGSSKYVYLCSGNTDLLKNTSKDNTYIVNSGNQKYGKPPFYNDNVWDVIRKGIFSFR